MQCVFAENILATYYFAGTNPASGPRVQFYVNFMIEEAFDSRCMRAHKCSDYVIETTHVILPVSFRIRLSPHHPYFDLYHIYHFSLLV